VFATLLGPKPQLVDTVKSQTGGQARLRTVRVSAHLGILGWSKQMAKLQERTAGSAPAVDRNGLTWARSETGCIPVVESRTARAKRAHKTTWEPSSTSTLTATRNTLFRAEISGFEPPDTPQIQQVYVAMNPLLVYTLAPMHLPAFYIPRARSEISQISDRQQGASMGDEVAICVHGVFPLPMGIGWMATWPPGIPVSYPPEPHMRITRAVSPGPLGTCCLIR
ncbi:hypothetical protein THAOC_03825, partial [Thalassiosira oceanica]